MSYNSTNAIGVFLSYSHSDRFAAEALAKRLGEIGYHLWIDFTGILGGTEWRESIDSALRQCDAVLVLLTPDSVASEWVSFEVSLAKKNQRPIIPLLIRSCHIPYDLEFIQYVDFSRDAEAGFKELQRALILCLLKKTDAEPSADSSFSESLPSVESSLNKQKSLALVIEDVSYYRKFLRDILTELGLEVHTVSTRNEAISRIRENLYTLITLDMQLGPDDDLQKSELGQDGLYILSRLKRYQPNVPIIVISSLEWHEEGDDRISSGDQIKAILRKPLNEAAQDQLSELVEIVLKNQGVS